MPTVLLYLGSIVAANLVTAAFGPVGSVLTSLLLIGGVLTLRDRLHDRWAGRRLPLRLGLLLLAGGALSALLNRDALPIAVASVSAFLVSETADAILYHALRHFSWLRRVTGSNLLSAALDSIVFPTIAFGGFLWYLTVAEFAAKVIGGLGWAILLRPRRAPAEVTASVA